MLPDRRAEREPEEAPPDAPLEGDRADGDETRYGELARAILETRIDALRCRPAPILPADATVARAIAVMRDREVGAVVVVDKRRPGRVVGIFTERDLVQRALGRRGHGRVRLEKVMTPEPETLRPSDRVAYALNRLSVGRFQHVPLVDERGAPLGVLSSRDVIDFLVELMPEGVLNLPPEPDLAIASDVDGG